MSRTWRRAATGWPLNCSRSRRTSPPANALAMQIISVKISVPMAREHWVQPKDYKVYFPRKVPAGAAARRDYAREILADSPGAPFGVRRRLRPWTGLDEIGGKRLPAARQNVRSRRGPGHGGDPLFPPVSFSG